MQAGLVSRPLGVWEVIARRLFVAQVGLEGRWRQYYWGEVETRALKGVDSLYSILQMPRGYPVATMAIGAAGAGAGAAETWTGGGGHRTSPSLVTVIPRTTTSSRCRVW